MKYPFKHISLMWRSSRGERRICIGNITVLGNGAISFKYDMQGVEEAKKIKSDFSGYPGLALNTLEHKDSEYLKNLFSLRLINLERTDRKELLDFWLLDDEVAQDVIMLLAMTQGMSLADMFEFVPHFQRDNTAKRPFVTDLAALSVTKFDISSLHNGLKLQFEREPDNPYDKNAVKVLYNGQLIGYIKNGHNYVFKGRKGGISLYVHKITTSPNFTKLYIKVIY